jgi:uncharacterized membrane protein
MPTQFRGAVLAVATLAMGLMAGVFGLYAHTLMRGLGNTDDRTFVEAFQEIDRAIINPVFMLTFLGALALTALSAVLFLRAEGAGRSVAPWVVVALGLYVVVFLVTMAIHVPLNDDIKAAGDPDQIANLAAVRDAFNESRWVAWNVVRTIACTAAFGCLLWGLVLHGRSEGSGSSGGHRDAVSERVPAGLR